MKVGGSLQHSQEPATSSYPAPDRSTPCPHTNSVRSTLILSSHLRLDFPSNLFSSAISTKTLYALLLSPVRATCIAISVFFYIYNINNIKFEIFTLVLKIIRLLLGWYILAEFLEEPGALLTSKTKALGDTG